MLDILRFDPLKNVKLRDIYIGVHPLPATNYDRSKDFRWLSFDGVDDYVNAGNHASLGVASAISISVWVQVNAAQTGKGMITKGPAGADYDYMLYISGGASPNIDFLVKDSLGVVDDTGVTGLVFGLWYHIVAVFDGDYIWLYKNGLVAKTKDTLLTNIRVSTNILRIGSGFSGFFKGLIDDIWVWNRALSASEILALYEKRNSDVSTSGLVLFHNYKTGTAKDISGSENNGIVYGAQFQ